MLLKKPKIESSVPYFKQFAITLLLTVACFFLISMKYPDFMIQDPWVAPEEFQTMENPFKDYKDEERLGKRLFSKNCQQCHGKTGTGDGEYASLFGFDMIDFTDGIIKNQSDGSIFYKINKGRGNMPGFKVKLSDDKDKWLIINYLRSLTR